jgi:hypothetical protein
MPVPYRKTPRNSPRACAAFLDAYWIASRRKLIGALLLIDGRGQPLEFVHNAVSGPDGFLWPGDQVLRECMLALCHSLFDACKREPELLIGSERVGAAEFCRSELAPAIPFALVTPTEAGVIDWGWVNNPPSASMTASDLAEEIKARGFSVEPFDRIRRGLQECYGDEPWREVLDDPPAEP